MLPQVSEAGAHADVTGVQEGQCGWGSGWANCDWGTLCLSVLLWETRPVGLGDSDCLLVHKHEHTRVHVCVSIDRIVDIHLSL